MRKAIQRSQIIVFCITVAAGMLGYLYGRFVLAPHGVGWWLPDNLSDKEAFITVGSIHNFSYLGGLVGLLTGIIYLVRKRTAIQQEQKF